MHITLYILYIYMYVCIYIYIYICMKFFHLPEIVTASWHKGRALHDHFATLGSARAGVGIFCGSWLCRCLGTQWCVSLPMGVNMGKSWSSWTIDFCDLGGRTLSGYVSEVSRTPLVHVIGKFPSLGFKPWEPEWKLAKWLDPPLSGWSNPTDMNFD